MIPQKTPAFQPLDSSVCEDLGPGPKVTVDIYDFLTDVDLEVEKGGALKVNNCKTQKFYFRVSAGAAESDFFIEATKSIEDLGRDRNPAISYVFNVYFGNMKKSVVSISLSGEQSDLKQRGQPLQEYIHTSVAEPILRDEFLVQAGIARIIIRTYSRVEEVTYNY